MPGFDADLVIWDPKAKFVVNAEDILCRNKDTSPYIGKELMGVVKRYKVLETGRHKMCLILSKCQNYTPLNVTYFLL